jgi:threonine aldolase
MAEARASPACYDSVSVCFSKGLGAPVGSALVRHADLIRPRPPPSARWPAAACARRACWPPRPTMHWTHHVDRLADDHANARRLAEGLAGRGGDSPVLQRLNGRLSGLVPCRI